MPLASVRNGSARCLIVNEGLYGRRPYNDMPLIGDAISDGREFVLTTPVCNRAAAEIADKSRPRREIISARPFLE